MGKQRYLYQLAVSKATGSSVTVQVNANAASNVSFLLLNTNGAVIKKQSIALLAGTNNIPVDVRSLPAGNYLIRFNLSGTTTTERFIKL